MEAAISQRGLIFLLTSIGLMVLPHVMHVPLPLIGFFFILLGWRLLGVWRPAYLPNQLLVLLLLVTGIGILVLMHQGVFGRDAGTAVFITALGLKLLEIKQRRDLYLITYLAFIVAASQFLYMQSLLMVGYIVLVSISLLATLISMNAASISVSQSLKVAGRIFLQAVPLMAIMFVFFPRVEAPRWSFLQENNQAMSGLSDVLEPGAISKLGMSGEIVFRAKFDGKIPTHAERYWRGPVFSYTDGKRWRQTKNTHFKRFMDKVSFSGEPYHYQLLMEPQTKNWVFALDMPADFSPPLNSSGTYQLRTSKTFNQRAEYQLSSYSHYNTGYITKTELSDNLQLPGNPDARVQELVAQLGGFDSTPEIFITNLFQHFRKNNFYYTLMPPLMGDQPIETFLFDAQAGFCGHYATAFVYLMRVAGIPARVVGGYQGGSYNKTGSFIEVRQANAHAWAEVWLSGKGWVRYDPTTAIAPERVQHGVNIEQQIANNTVSFSSVQLDSKTLALMKRMRSLWSSMDYSWQRWIINYDRQHQLDFMQGLGIDSLKQMFYWLVGLVGLVTFLLAIYVFRQQAPVLDKVQIVYAKACQKLMRAGLIKGDNEGAQDFLLRVNEKIPQVAVPFARITALYIQLRYGYKKEERQLAQLKMYVRDFRVLKEENN